MRYQEQPRVYTAHGVRYVFYDDEQYVVVLAPGVPPTCRPMTDREIHQSQQMERVWRMERDASVEPSFAGALWEQFHNPAFWRDVLVYFVFMAIVILAGLLLQSGHPAHLGH